MASPLCRNAGNFRKSRYRQVTQGTGRSVCPALQIRAGYLLRVKNDDGDFQIEVLVLTDARPGRVAELCADALP